MKVCPGCGELFAGDRWECPACRFVPRTVEGFISFFAGAQAGGGFEPDCFAELVELEAGNFWFCARNRLIVEMLRRHFPSAGSFLEIGCGTGYVLSGIASAFPRLRLTGSEFFCAGLRFARQRLPQADLYQMDARAIPFVSEFDVIGAFDVLEHVEEDTAVLAQMCNATRPGGGLLLTVPQHPWLWSGTDERASHVRRYRATDLRRQVVASGYEVVCMTSFVAWLLPVLAVTRCLERLRRVDTLDRLPAGLKLPRPVDRLFEVVLALERKTIAAGLRYPLGGSLLMVARKR